MADLTLAIRIATEAFGTEKIGDVEQALGGLGRSSAAAKNLLPAVAGATAGLTAALGGSVAVAAEFEKTMDGALAVMSPADVNTFGASLENLALRLGKDTSFSAKEAAAGIEELVKGGLSATDILNGAAESTLALAAAGGVSLPDAATIAANALAQFSLKGEDMAQVADLIAGAANASAIDVNQFKFSLQAAGAVAATVGFDFDDLATGIAVMGKAGIAGSDAGTSLKTMMLNLIPTTKAQVAEFERLGIVGFNMNGVMEDLTNRISGNEAAQKAWAKHVKDGTATAENLFKVAQGMGGALADIDFNKYAFDAGFMGNQFFDATGKVRPMAEVAEILKTAMADMTEQQRLASLEILFGSDAIRAGAILAKEGAAGFNEMAAAMGQVTATDVAAARLDNLNGSMEQMSGSMETVGITIGKILLPAARLLIDAVTGVLNGFLGLSPEVQRFVTYGLVAATALGAVGTAGLALLAILPAIVSGFGAAATIAGVVGGVLAGPVVLAIGGVVLAVAALAYAWNNNFGGIQDKARVVASFLSDTVWPAIRSGLSFVTDTALPAFGRAWETVSAAVVAVVLNQRDKIVAVFDAIRGAIAFVTDTALPFLERAWVATWAATGSLLTSVWELLAGTVFKPLFDTLNVLTTVILPALGEGFRLVAEGIGVVWAALWETILLPGLTALGDTWKLVWDAVSLKATEVWDAIQKKVADTWKVVWTDTLAVGLKTLGDTWTLVWDGATKKLADTWDGFLKKITDTWRAIWDERLQPGIDSVATAWQKLWDDAQTALSTAWTNILAKLDEHFGEMLRRFGKLAEDAFESAKQIGAKIMEGIGSAIGEGVDSVINAVRGAIDRAISAANEALKRMPTAPKIPTFGRGGPSGADAQMPEVEDAGAWVSPMRGVVTQEFGKTPYSHVYPGGIHTGIDVAASGHAPIVAARSGRVDIAGYDNSGYGNLVAITHPGGLRTLYAHLSSIDVRPGQNVLSGQLIGRQGSTGNSTGNHLHFEIREAGRATNPRRYTGFATGGVVPGPIGAGTPILAHGGEVILRPDQAQAMGGMVMRALGGAGASDADMQRMAAYIASAVAGAMAGMSVRIESGGFSDAVVGAIVDSTRRGRLSQGVNEAFRQG